MCEGQMNQISQPRNVPNLPTSKPNIKVKVEPLSPDKQQHRDTETKGGNTQKKWRRQTPKTNLGKQKEVSLNGKRKEDAMDVDTVELGTIKRTKINNVSLSIITVEAAEQPRRTS